MQPSPSPDSAATGAGSLLERPTLLSVLFLTCIFFVNFTGRVLTGPLLPALEADLGFNHAVSGFFILMVGVGALVARLFASYIIAASDYRRAILLALFSQALSLGALSFFDEVAGLALGFLVAGFAGSLYTPAGIALLAHLVVPREWGKAMAIHELAPTLAMIAAPFIATFFLFHLGWRGAYLALALAAALGGMAYVFRGPGKGIKAERPRLADIGRVMKKGDFWVVVALLNLGVVAEAGLYAILPLFLVSERGWELEQANYILGLSRVPCLGMVLISGWLTDRLSPGRTMGLALAVAAAAVLCMALGPDYLIGPAIFVQAAAGSSMLPPALSAASAISDPENRSLIISWSLALVPLLGNGLVPAGIAFMGQVASFSAGLVVAGLLLASGLWLVRILKLPQH